jgi:hypothetical protein
MTSPSAGEHLCCNNLKRKSGSKSLTLVPLFQDEAKKKTLEADLLAGEELQALAKEVIVQPPEIIGQIRKLMGE